MTEIALMPALARFDRQYRASTRIVGLARKIICIQAEQWKLPESVTDSVIRSVSELTANAVAVSGSTDLIKIRFELFSSHVLLSVFDLSPREPRASAPCLTLEDLDALPDEDDPSTLPVFGGWGLPLVASLADAGGIHRISPDPHSGKWVWARFNLRGNFPSCSSDAPDR